MLQIPVDNRLCMTGEVSIHGFVKPVGGVVAKVEAAFQAGANKVLVPRENYQDLFAGLQGLQVIGDDTIQEVLQESLGIRFQEQTAAPSILSADVLTAAPAPFFHAGPNE
ncbi:Lon protease 2 [compost metagenome]